jgi:hypothetical protein
MEIWVGVTDKDWFNFLSRINADIWAEERRQLA